MSDNLNSILEEKIAEAWDHANNQRNLNLILAISNIALLLQMRGDGDVSEFIVESQCGYKDKLASVSNYLNLNWRRLDSGYWYWPLEGETTGPPENIPRIVFVE